MSRVISSPIGGFIDTLARLADASRQALEAITPQQSLYIFSTFPSGACGPATELFGRLVAEMTGQEGVYVCGSGHPELRPQQSHAWLEVGGFIVDLTYDQFPGTGLEGWVFEKSRWHESFRREIHPLCLLPSQWAQYPYAAYAAMQSSCGCKD